MQSNVCFFKQRLVQRVSLLGLVLFLTSTPLLAQYAPGVTVAGGNGHSSAANQLSRPYGVTLDGVGNIFAVDSNNDRVQKWAPGASSGVTAAGGNGQGSAANQFDNPQGVALDGAGNVYVYDTYNNRVQKWAPGATSGVTVAGGNEQGTGENQLYAPGGVAVDNAGNVYVADANNERVVKWAPGATSGTVVAGVTNRRSSEANQLAFPRGVFVDGAGNLYIADYFNQRIQKWAPGATEGVTVAGGNGQGAAASQLHGPTGVYVDETGAIYIADLLNYRIQKWALGATSGVTIAGGNGKGSAVNQLAYPYGLWVDGSGNVYVADADNDRIQKFAPISISITSQPASASAVCVGSTATATVGVSLEPFMYRWYKDNQTTPLPGQTSATLSLTNVQLSDAGSYKAVITGSANSLTTTAFQLTVGPPPVSLSSSGNLSCATPSVTLTASPGSGVTYAFSAGATQVGNTNTARVTQSGTYSVVITSAGGCTASASVGVSGSSSPPSVSLSASGVISCTNPTVTLTATPISGASYVFSSGATQVDNGNTATVTQAGTYSVIVTDPNGCSASASVTVSGTCVPANLSVSHWDADYNQPTNNVIRPYLQLTNIGTTPVPYGEITLRYWLTVEDFSPLTNLSVYWAQLGRDKVKMKYIELGSPRQGALGYVEYSFDASAGSLAPGANSGPIQSGIGKQNWTAFNESDDYSYANRTSFQLNDRITIYRNGQLVGGQEPASTAAIEQLKVYTQANSSASTNTINTYLQLRNEGNRPISYGDVSLRYYFTADGSQPLNFYLDYALLGNANVQARFVRPNLPLANADTYLELRFPAGLGQLYPLSGTGNTQYRIAKSDWSPFSQSNDHSYLASPSFVENSRVVVYVGNQRVYGQEPGAAGARQGADVSDVPLQVVVLGNPVRGPELDVEIAGASGEVLGLELRDLQGQIVSQKQVLGGKTSGRHRLSVAGQPTGLLLLRVSTPTQVKVIKVIKAE